MLSNPQGRSQVVDQRGRVFLGPFPEELRLRADLRQRAGQLDLTAPPQPPFSFQRSGQLDHSRSPPRGGRGRSPRPRSPRSRSPRGHNRSRSPRRLSPQHRQFGPSARFPVPPRVADDLHHRGPLRPPQRWPPPRRRSPQPYFEDRLPPPVWRQRSLSPQRTSSSRDLDSVRTAAAEAVPAVIVPLQQSIVAFQQREQERSLPPVQKPAFAAVLASLQLLPGPTQDLLQPFYQALRAADSVDSEEQAIRALQPLVQYCLEHPAASTAELRQHSQLLTAGGQLHLQPLLSGLLAAGNPSLLPLLSAVQPAAAAAPALLAPPATPFATGVAG